MAVSSTSNLDVNSIVSQLMAVERRPVAKLDLKEANYQARLSAYGSVKGAVAGFQSAVQSLSSSSKFQAVKATVSDSTIFSASASSSAVAGTYSLEVTTLAQAQKLVATGKPNSTGTIGTGTITFDFGTITGTPADGKYPIAPDTTFVSNGNGNKVVVIDSSNNSLQGIRDAINAAKIGVTATIINDGDATNPYRLALSSDNNGVSNSMKISVAGGDGNLATFMAHDPTATQNLTETATAQNANFKVNGVAVSKTSNTVSDVVQGVTLTLNKVTTSPVALTVARDTAAVSGSISAFVKAYNDLAKTLKDVSAYDAASKKGAILQGDSTVRGLQSQLRGMLNTSVVGTSGALTTLSDVGVSFQKDGTLALNQTKLDSAIANNFSDIAGLFAATGKATDSLVSFSSSTSSTKAGSYDVSVNTLATQGSSTGNFNLNAGLNTIDSDTAINVTLDGTTAAVTLTAGTTYTATQLAMMIQSAINGTSAFSSAGSSVAATINGSGFLALTSNRYGSASNVSMSSSTGTLVSAFMGTEANIPGVDVAGTIGGVTATGSGQTLSAASGNAQGLSILINGGLIGARGTLNYSQGYAYLLDKWATSNLASDGTLASRTEGVSKTITDIGKQRDAMNARLVGIEKRYRAQFTALDQMLSSMNLTSNYLTQQLAQISNLR